MLSARTWDAWYASSLAKAHQNLRKSRVDDSRDLRLVCCVCALVLLQTDLRCAWYAAGALERE